MGFTYRLVGVCPVDKGQYLLISIDFHGVGVRSDNVQKPLGSPDICLAWWYRDKNPVCSCNRFLHCCHIRRTDIDEHFLASV